MTDDLLQRIHDAIAACRAILDFTSTASFESYAHDLLLRSAVERQFEILGEALNHAYKFDPTLHKNFLICRES